LFQYKYPRLLLCYLLDSAAAEVLVMNKPGLRAYREGTET
jgi:hypothetical protein